MKTSNIQSTLFVGILLSISAANTHSADRIKADNNNSLNTAASWTNGVPTSLDRAVWDGTVTTNNVVALGADTNWLGVAILNPGGPVNITAGNVLTLGASGIDLSAATADLTVDCGFKLGVNQPANVGASRVLALNGVINGNAAKVLAKTGSGTLVLGGGAANTNGFSLTVSNGIAQLAKSAGNALSNLTVYGGSANITGAGGDQIADAGIVTLGSGATLDLNGHNETLGNLRSVNSGDGTVTSATTATLTFANGSGTFSGTIGGALALVKSGAGTETLNGFNSYTGDTTINGGTLSINADGALGATTNVVINGGTLNASADMDLSARPLRLGPTVGSGSGTLGVGGGATLSYGGQARDNGAGSGNLVKTGGGTLVLSATNLYTGTTTVNAGTLQLNDGGWFGPNTGAISLTGGTLAFNRTDNLVVTSQLTGGTVSEIAGATLTLAGTTANTASASVTAGVLQLGKTGVSACNNLALNGGNVMITGTGGNQISGDIIFNGGVFDLNGQNEAVGSVTANNNPVAGLANNLTGTTATLSASFGINSVSEVSFNTVAGSTLKLTNPAGTPSAINGGYLHVTGAGTTVLVLGVGGLTDFTAGIWTIDSGTTLQMGDGGANGIPFSVGVNDNGTLAFNTSLANIAQNAAVNGGGALTKSGTGKVTLGNSNGYTGNTTINGGVLALGGGGIIASSPLVSIAGGASFDVTAKNGGGGYTIPDGQTLAGSGTVLGRVTANPNTQILAGGAGVAGTLTFSANLTLAAGFAPQFDVGSTTGSSRDLVQVNAGLILNGNTVTINLLGGSIAPGTYRLMNYTGARTGTLDPTPVFNPPGATGTISLSTTNQVNLIVTGGGSGPTNQISGIKNNGDGTLTLAFSGQAGGQYYVVATDSLTPPVVWTPLPGSTNTAAGDGSWAFTATSSGPRQFYRAVRLTP